VKGFLIPLIAVICSLVLPCWSFDGEERMKWLTHYEDAVKQSKEQSKPLLLFFTGTGWCPACAKLEQEVFDTSMFAELAGDKYVFVKLDFPQDKSLIDGQTAAQNKQLLKKFDVRSFPTVILLEPKNQVQMGITGYRPGGPRQYAAHLGKIVNDYSFYNQKMQKIDGQQLSGSELKGLYEKARELDLVNDIQSLLKVGMKSDQKNYFLLERYRWLAEEGLINEKDAAAIKQQLLAVEASNQQKIQYEMAIIAFEAFSQDEDNMSSDERVAPLVAYLEKFGAQDKDNLWRLNMIISQVYLNKDHYSKALDYARLAYQNAPDNMKADIGIAVNSLELQTNKH
jgi:protein disulfide-isomerase